MARARLLQIELEQWATRPVGRLSDESGHEFEFDGWVSLAAALESICRRGAGRDEMVAEPGGPDTEP
jgi:hypothetical protein